MTNPQGNRGWAAVVVGAIVMMLATVINAPAQTFTSLVSFNGTDGSSPYGSLIQGVDANLYGTAFEGGGFNSGTIFKTTATGTVTTLYSFCSKTLCTDGANPGGGLVLAASGNFYGTTEGGGIHSKYCEGCGTVFEATPSGTLTTLYRFCAQPNCTDGASPFARLVQALDGNLYGTTSFGGANNACGYPGCGTVFKITPRGRLTTLYSFCAQSGCTDGFYPAGLVQATDGNFYGTTEGGGTPSNYCEGCGTVFKITPSGTLTTLYTFCAQPNCTDGAYPFAGLVQASDGNFYGTTSAGGGTSGYGTVFEITAEGALTTLNRFDETDGSGPFAGLIQASNGDLYGTTKYGGTNNNGTVFEITPGGSITALYSFCSQTNCIDGANPYAGLVQATNGSLYGTTIGGGAYYGGTIFLLSTGLGPFVETDPTSGKVGKPVKILGTDVEGATSVTFNGVPATFKVISPSEIGASVPSGATTGPVQVVTPSGTLTSNMNFQVLP